MSIVFKEETLGSIPTPATGKTSLFVDDSDGRLKRKTDAGSVVDIELASAGVTSFESRTGAVTAQSGDYIASEITNTPAGGIAATDVQAAINELDTEKLAASHAGTGGTAHAQVTTSVDGFMIAADKTKLDGIATGATANSADSFLLDRTNHTGTQAAASVTGSAGFVASFDTSGFLQATPGISIDATSGGINDNFTTQPNNAAAFFNLHNGYLGFDPIANSPSDAWNVVNRYIEFDVNSNGFTQGTAGESVCIYSNSFSHQGTGDVGGLSFIKNGFEIGNGTDPISVKGMAYAFGFGSFHDNVTINGPLQGYGFQPNATNLVAFTSAAYTTGFYDAANVQTAVYGWNSFSASPSIAEIQNNTNYTSFFSNPTITTFAGNSNFYGLGIYPNIGTMGTGGFTGINVNPSVTSCVNATGLYINMGSVTASGTKRAIDVVGDVNINGGLAFTGSLSMGQLSAFYSTNPVDGGGNPQALHGLITEMVALNGVTTANCDAIGVNTAMLIRIEANSINTSGPFGLGFASLALPCVVETHTGSSLDFMTCAGYALNLAGTSTGGTIDRVNLCRALAIPNGITTVNELVGFLADAPFGDVGTDSWGFYASSANANNYFANFVRIGAGSDKVTNAQALEVVGTVQLNGDIGFFGTTEASQQTGGAATAGVVYTATEQGMLQTVYDALRTYGLLS